MTIPLKTQCHDSAHYPFRTHTSLPHTPCTYLVRGFSLAGLAPETGELQETRTITTQNSSSKEKTFSRTMYKPLTSVVIGLHQRMIKPSPRRLFSRNP